MWILVFIWMLIVASMTDALQRVAYKSASKVFRSPNLSLMAKKSKKNMKAPGGGSRKGQDSSPSKAQRQGQVDRFDALTRQYMFTMTKVSKTLPQGKQILKDINLCFYPGAKIGVVGLNGSGKSSLLKIMAGVDTQFDGTAVPMPGASVGYLPQEPILRVRLCKIILT